MDLETILDWIEAYGVLAVFLGTLADSSGLQMFTVAGGIAAELRDGFSIWWVMLAGLAANVTSDMLLYAIGRWRARWLDRVVKSDKGKARLELISKAMQRWAIPILIFGRFLPWFGRFVPAAAGLRYVNRWRALIAVSIGGALCSALYASMGYFLGRSVREFEGLTLWIWGGALVVSIPLASFLLKRFDRRVERLLKENADSQAKSES